MSRSSSKHGRVLAASLLAVASLAIVSYATAAPSDDVAEPPAITPAPDASPTWAVLYRKYLAKDTVGDCASCHEEAATSDGAYAWLAQQQYMSGSPPYLVDLKASCFSWLGGDMPPDGPSSYPRAQREFQAWASAGGGKD
jgi:hypothetical protein